MELTTVSARDRLIVALDFADRNQAIDLVRALGDEVGFYKVGLTLFLSAGREFVETLTHEYRKKVFLDLKLNDIGATIQDAVAVVAEMDVEFLTLMGTRQAVEGAVRGRGSKKRPRLLSVTYLSSMDATDLEDVSDNDRADLPGYIRRRAIRFMNAGADGLIASGESVADLRAALSNPSPVIVTPGIRPPGAALDDQKRSLTPSEAIRSGADYLVVGRPIRAASNPRSVAATLVRDIAGALDGRFL